jgi:hypothetical protein
MMQLLCCSESRTCIIIFYQYSLHWNWCTCQQSCYRRSANLWWTSLWYNEVREDTYCISFHVHICTVSLYPYEDSSVNSTSLSVRCDDRSVKKDERVSELTIVLAYGDKSESLIASKLNWIDVSTFKNLTELHWMIISNQLYVRHHWPSSFQSCSSYKLWYVNHSHCEDEKEDTVDQWRV